MALTMKACTNWFGQTYQAVHAAPMNGNAINKGWILMSPAIFPEAPVAQSQPLTDRVILIAGGSPNIKLAEDLRYRLIRKMTNEEWLAQ
jgi:hypothetical protein